MTGTSSSPYAETGNPFIDGLLSGAFWELGPDRTITWSLGNSQYQWYERGYQLVQAAFDVWESVINVDFVYTGNYTDFRYPSADIVLSISDYNNLFAPFYDDLYVINGLGLFPNSDFAHEFVSYYGETKYSYPNPEGDVFFNINSPIFQYDNYGSKTFQVVLHEIGHALGLKHPHDNGLAGYTTYAEAGYDEYDNGYLTVMSYEPTSSIWQYGWAATLLPFDILAAQEMYGANITTNTGDTLQYLFDDGRLRTIYDVSGNDTINASEIQHGVTLQLSDGYWSDLGDLSTVYIAIGTEIENAVGTSWDDYIDGNEISNALSGLDGNDQIKGLGGDDFIWGGGGVDLLIGNGGNDELSGGQGNDELQGGEGHDKLFGDLGDDTLFGDTGEDELYGGEGDDNLVGGSGDDVLYGQSGNDKQLQGGEGNDIIYGGEGNDNLYGEFGHDVLYGGDNGDKLFGGDGDDILNGEDGDDYLIGGAGNDTINGGSGFDYAFYSSVRFTYDISETDEFLLLEDLTGEEGVDTIQQVEYLFFNDYMVSIDITKNAAKIPSFALEQLQELYVAFFNRIPEAVGLNYWINQYDSGVNINSIAEQFYNAGIQYSDVTGFSAGMSNTDFINVVYTNVLGRENGADTAGLAYWNNALETGSATNATIVAAILDSAHTYKGDAEWGWVADLLDNKIEVANIFAVDYGLSYYTPEESITSGMAIAAAVTDTDITVALELIGIVTI